MLRTITATVCKHPIRSSAEIPHSINGINFAIPYCGACAKSRNIAAENDAADRAHKRLQAAQDLDGDRSELRIARIRCRKAHLVFVQDQEQSVDGYHTEHEQPRDEEAAGMPMELDSILKDPAISSTKKDLTVKFSFTDYYRPEEEYRDQLQFNRTAAHYERGLYADETGSGFINTSDPYASDTSSDLSDFTSGEEFRDGEHEESSDERMEDSSDEEMTDFVCDTGGEDDAEGEDEEDEGGVHVPTEEEQDGGEEGNGGLGERLTREEMMERSRVLQERIDDLCQKHAQSHGKSQSQV